jgi:hypothetical protein
MEISWVDCPYTASTCDVMYCRQRRHLYYGGGNLKYYLTLFPPRSSFILGQRWQPIQMGHSLHIGEGEGGGLDDLLMSMIHLSIEFRRYTPHSFADNHFIFKELYCYRL